MQNINQLPHLVREIYLLKAVVAMYRKLCNEKIRPEAEVLTTICSVTYQWWHMIYGRPGYTRKIRHALRGMHTIVYNSLYSMADWNYS